MQRGIIWYLVIAFGGAWLLWELAILSGAPMTSPTFQLLLIPGGFAPAVAALVVRNWVTREGFADAGLKLNLRAWRFYLFALLLPLAVVATIAVESTLLGIASPDFSMLPALRGLGAGRPLPPNLPPWLGLAIIPQVLVSAVIVTPLLWGEEFGWRGYLQQRLFAGRPEAAAVATGLIWGVWHYPLILRGYDFPGHPFAGAAVFTVAAILLSVIFGWLRQASGSVWCASLAHAATNAAGGSLVLLWFYGRADMLVVNYLGILGLPPLTLVAAWILATGRLRRSAVSAV